MLREKVLPSSKKKEDTLGIEREKGRKELN